MTNCTRLTILDGDNRRVTILGRVVKKDGDVILFETGSHRQYYFSTKNFFLLEPCTIPFMYDEERAKLKKKEAGE